MLQQDRACKILAIGGGKGGTGKSFLATHIGILLAKHGLRVVLVDADYNGANLHTFFGLTDPQYCLSDLLDSRCKIEQSILPTSIKKLSLLPGFWSTPSDTDLSLTTKTICQQLTKLKTDIAIWDVGSGNSIWATYLFAQADIGVLVSLPESPCIERDYRFLRHVYHWCIADLLPPTQQPSIDWLPIPWLSQLKRTDHELTEILYRQLQQKKLMLLTNAIRLPEDRELSNDMAAVCRRFFGVNSQALGWLEFDERVWLSIRQKRPLIIDFPDSQFLQQLQHILNGLLPFVSSRQY
jgi:flagellar biosynthesis protein FlhG